MQDFDSIHARALDDYLAKRFLLNVGRDFETEAQDLVNAKLETITDEEFHDTFTEAEFSFPELYKSLILQVKANDQVAVGHIFQLMIKRQLETQAKKALRSGKRFDEVWA